MLRKSRISMFWFALSLAPAAHAAGLQPVRAADGLVCMSLDAQSAAAMSQQDLPPLLAAPSNNASVVGYPTSIVFVRHPTSTRNGYTQIVRLNGQNAWLASDHLVPWHPMNGAATTCTPSIMSNGHLGTEIH